MLRALISYLLAPGILFKVPAGITPDPMANFGMFGFLSNANNYAESTLAVTTAGTAVTLTPLQALCGMTLLNVGASGAFTITLPTTAQIIAALGPTVPTDGSYAEPIHMLNNGVGQTGTLTAGDASTTLTGTMTVATNTVRKFILTVGPGNTVTIQNCGSWSL